MEGGWESVLHGLIGTVSPILGLGALRSGQTESLVGVVPHVLPRQILPDGLVELSESGRIGSQEDDHVLVHSGRGAAPLSVAPVNENSSSTSVARHVTVLL